MLEKCAICGCGIHRDGEYAKPTVKGRAHATKHHYIAERFFGRSTNRRGTQRDPIFKTCPSGAEKETVVFCYECHEVLVHNPVFLPEDIQVFSALVENRKLSEKKKPKGQQKLAGRIELLHEVIEAGLASLTEKTKS